MAITKETQIGKIEVVGKYKAVQVRTDIVIMDSEVQAVCNAVWTQDVKDAWTTFKANQENN
jgi:hypothetical protein